MIWHVGIFSALIFCPWSSLPQIALSPARKKNCSGIARLAVAFFPLINVDRSNLPAVIIDILTCLPRNSWTHIMRIYLAYISPDVVIIFEIYFKNIRTPYIWSMPTLQRGFPWSRNSNNEVGNDHIPWSAKHTAMESPQFNTPLYAVSPVGWTNKPMRYQAKRPTGHIQKDDVWYSIGVFFIRMPN